MFLWQRKKYNLTVIKDVSEFESIFKELENADTDIIAWDTETTGLNFLKDKPFLVGFGFCKNIYIIEAKKELIEKMYELASNGKIKYFQAHNAKYDYHMMINKGTPVPETVNISDSLALARITDYVDSLESISLAALGQKLVDENAKFAADVIKKHVGDITNARRLMVKKLLKEKLGTHKIGALWEEYMHRIQYIPSENEEIFEWLDKIYSPANYQDSYFEQPDLMINYLADDILLELEVSKKLFSVLKYVDPTGEVFERENKLIRAVGDFERNGLRVDVDYIINAKKEVEDYKDLRYKELHKLVGLEFTVGQEKVIKHIYKVKYKIGLQKTDSAALSEIINKYDGEAVEVAKRIQELRTIDKWLSTYIIGYLNKLVDGRVYTEINNSGAVTGRVSSDLQQMPSKPIVTFDGRELFHPRKTVIKDEGTELYFIDYANMEMRVQANYTLEVATGDLNMCRAFIPFKCKSTKTGEEYDPEKDYNSWNSGEWVDEDGNKWKATDLHSLTAMTAFPDVKESDSDFKKYRDIGKRANFLKIYGGGYKALMDQLDLNEEQAKLVDTGYYKAYPVVKEYQNWVNQQVNLFGFVESSFMRRYYIQSSQWTYRLYNYLIQGDCAYLLKQKEIEIMNFIKENGLKTKLLLVIHDEVILDVAKGEEGFIESIKDILEDTRKYIKHIPMLCEVSKTESNWAMKKKI